MSHHRAPDPIEENEVVPAHAHVRRASVKRAGEDVEIVMPSTIDDAILYFVSKPAAQRAKTTKPLPAPTEPFEAPGRAK